MYCLCGGTKVNDIGVEDPLDVAVDSNGFIYVTGCSTSYKT